MPAGTENSAPRRRPHPVTIFGIDAEAGRWRRQAIYAWPPRVKATDFPIRGQRVSALDPVWTRSDGIRAAGRRPTVVGVRRTADGIDIQRRIVRKPVLVRGCPLCRGAWHRFVRVELWKHFA